jgi:hypothetical protein
MEADRGLCAVNHSTRISHNGKAEHTQQVLQTTYVVGASGMTGHGKIGMDYGQKVNTDFDPISILL